MFEKIKGKVVEVANSKPVQLFVTTLTTTVAIYAAIVIGVYGVDAMAGYAKSKLEKPSTGDVIDAEISTEETV